MAEYMIVAQDRRDRPTCSLLVTGPDVPAEDVLRQYNAARGAKVHPQQFEWLMLWSSERGVVQASYVKAGEKHIVNEPKKRKEV